MSNKYVPSPSDLYKAWSVPRSSEQAQQLTVRIPADTMLKIKAIGEMFPGRSRNEIISDLLATAVEQFEESLTSEWKVVGKEPIDWNEDTDEPIIQEKEFGPRGDFHRIIDKLKKEVISDSETNIRSLEKDAS